MTYRRDPAFLQAHITACQGIIHQRDTVIEGAREPHLILTYFGDGDGAPAYRVIRSGDWERLREDAGQSSWVPIAQVEIDGSLREL